MGHSRAFDDFHLKERYLIAVVPETSTTRFKRVGRTVTTADGQMAGLNVALNFAAARREINTVLLHFVAVVLTL
jgi:hypothetical protein